MRIGELAARSGVSVERLRAWERRYGVVSPRRSPGGFRLYTESDLERIVAMRALVEAGVPASEAARRVGTEPAPRKADRDEEGTLLPAISRRLREALDAWDEGAAQTALDDAFATFDFDTLVDQVFVPFLRELGERWARGEVSVAHEHFASSVLRGRLMAVARGWDKGFGPRLILACVPGELHDLPLVMFGILARRRGWRITFLGADTPVANLAQTRAALGPAGIVLASSTREGFEAAAADVAALAAEGPVALAGRGLPAPPNLAHLPCLPDSLSAAADALPEVFGPLLVGPWAAGR